MSRNLAASVFLALLLLVICWLQLNRPIYPDEIAYQLLNARAVQDGIQTLPSLYGAGCLQSAHTPLPFSWVPTHLISSTFFYVVNTPFLYRLSGVILFYFFIIQLWMISRKKRETSTSALLIPVFGLFLGTTPFVGVFLRPETILLLSLCFAVRIAQKNEDGPIQKPFINLSLVTALLFAIIPLHPKAFLLIPFFIFVGLVVARPISLFIKLPWLILVMGSSLVGFKTFSTRLICPEEASSIERLTAGQQLQPKSFIVDFWTSFQQLFLNLNPTPYYNHMKFQASHQVGWITGNSATPLVALGNFLIICSLMVFGSALVYKIYLYAKSRPKIASLYPFVLLICFLGTAAIQIAKNFYESYYLIGGLCIVLASLHSLKTKNIIFEKIAILLTAFLTSSCLLLTILNFKNLLNPQEYQGKGVPPYFAIEGSTNSNILSLEALIKTCNLREGPGYLAVDSLSYFAASKLPRLQYIDFLFSLINPGGEIEPEGLKKFKLRGAVVQCSLLPDSYSSASLKLKINEKTEYCCVDLRDNSEQKEGP